MIATLVLLAALAAPVPSQTFDRFTGRPPTSGSVATADPAVVIHIGLPEQATPGTVFQAAVRLVAVSGTPEPFTVLDLPIQWDPTKLELIGATPLIENLYADWYDDQWLDGFNKTWADGDAYYTLWGQPGNLPSAVPGDGLEVLRITFAVQPDAAPGLTMVICKSGGTWAKPAVYDDEIGGLNIGHCLAGRAMAIVSGEPSCPACDINGDGRVDLADYALLQRAIGGP